MNEAEMQSLVAEGRVARLATVRPDGSPHVVPIVYVLDGDTLYTAVDAKPKRTTDLQRLRNIESEPRVEIVVDHYEEDWQRIWWVRLRGRARLVKDGPEHERGAALLRAKYPQEEEQGLARMVIVEIEGWSGWAPR